MKMKDSFDLNEVSVMTGFSTRTLRTYMLQGLLRGVKVNGKWSFSLEELDRFFNDPYVREGVRIKRSGVVFDFMGDKRKQGRRACVILDLPLSLAEGAKLSLFFCEKMKDTHDVTFSCDRFGGLCRVILTGDEDEVQKLLVKYEEYKENKGSEN